MKVFIFLSLLACVIAEEQYAYRYVGCFRDSSEDRAFPVGPITRSNMKPIVCSQICDQFEFFGLQNGDECFCGDGDYDRHGKLSSDRCSTPCAGNEERMCGSGWVNSVYRNFEKTTPETSTPTPETTPLMTPEPTPEPPAVYDKYVGCFKDGRRESQRTMTRGYTSPKTNVRRCLNYCFRNGFNFAGLQNGDECWCSEDDSYAQKGRLPETRCNMCCRGATDCDRKCGSGYVNSVYTRVSEPETDPNFRLIGCFQDGKKNADRTMTRADNSEDMTVEKCVATCRNWGGRFAGLQYENECWCSNDRKFASIERLPESRCNFCCSGDPLGDACTNKCGSGWVNSVYKVKN